MNKNEVKRIVEKNAPGIAMALGLGNWKISFKYESLDAKNHIVGQCEPHVNYKRAWITLDAKQFPEEKYVISILRHELMHCVLSTFDTYKDAVFELLPDNEYKALRVIWKRALEEVVGDVCRIFEVKDEKDEK